MLLLPFLDILVEFSLNVEYFFLHFFFVQATITLIIKLYKTIPIKYNLKHNITLFSSVAHGFFNLLTAEIVIDLNDTQNRKPENTRLNFKSLDNLLDTSTNLINHSTGMTSLSPFYTKRPNKLSRLSKRPDVQTSRCPNLNYFRKDTSFSHPKTTLQTSTLPFSSDQRPSLPNYSNKNPHPNDNLATPHDTLTNTPVTSNTDTPIKIYSRVSYHFPPPSC